jgi:hypothetical protein
MLKKEQSSHRQSCKSSRRGWNEESFVNEETPEKELIYRKQCPIVNGLVIENQVFDSISQFEETLNNSCNSPANPHIPRKTQI